MESGGGDGTRASPPPSSTAQQQQLVESFCGITSSSKEEAVFFLESHNWQLDSAVHSFYDTNDDDDDQITRQQQEQLEEEEFPVPLPLPRQQQEPDEDDDDEDYLPPNLNLLRQQRRRRRKPPSSERSSRSSGGIRTLADLNRQPSGTGSDTDSDVPQEYYTGGEESGMLVRDPSKGNNIVDSILERARKTAVKQLPVENSSSQPSSSSATFTGTGRLLSGGTVVAGPQPEQPGNVVHNIVFWANGFTIDDGPLRRFDDPTNASMLESISKSECPKELMPSDRRSAVHVNLVKKEEKFPEPLKRKIPFQGVGRTLGASETYIDLETSGPHANNAAPSLESSSSVGLSVDDSLPSTSIQLRLADGTRMVARFNNHHTIENIRSFIDASRPRATRSYQLQTVGFPPKQLNDATLTIDEAGLANSVVIQRF